MLHQKSPACTQPFRPTADGEIMMDDPAPMPTVWHVGGDDVHKRIPLLHALRKRGFNVGAVGSEDGSAFEGQDIPYYHYTLQRKLTPFSDIQSCRELSALFKDHKPDVVHGFDPKPAIAVPLLARSAGVPARVRTITGLGFVMTSESVKARALRPIYRQLQRWASGASYTIFQNSDDREYFFANDLVEDGREEIVLGSGVDVEQIRSERPAPEKLAEMKQELGLDGQFVVTMISRIDENKGIHEFVEAADLVHQHMNNVTFLLVGPYASEGEEAARFVEDILTRPQTVRYLGPRKDIPALLALSDVCVLPSYREGLPRVLVEAAAIEVPMVTTDVPGCRDVVQDNLSGHLVPPKDSKALAYAILDLIGDQAKRKSMGDHGLRYVKEHFDLAKVADAYATIYRRALAEGF